MAQKTGAFGLPADADVSFITKDVNDVVIENHLNRLEQNILRFAKHVNFGDEAFAGNQSGVALKFKLFGLDSKCQTTELKFKRALQQQWQCITSAWAQKGSRLDYLDIYAEFSRNFPLNLPEEAAATVALKGMVSEPTRLALLSFVDDPAFELSLMQQEAEEAMAVQQEMFAAEAEIAATAGGDTAGGEGEDEPE
jgi:SPP1 family phage portal protein